MKKRNLSNLRLNKTQVSNLTGGTSNEPGTGSNNCTVTIQTIFQNTCQIDCASELRTCISEYGPACGTVETYGPAGCDIEPSTINPSR